MRASWRIFARLSPASITGSPTPASSVPAERAVCAVQGAMLCGSGRETPRSCDLAWLPFCHTGPASKLVRQMGRLMEFVAALILQYTSHRREYASPFLLAISDPRSSRHCIGLRTALYKMVPEGLTLRHRPSSRDDRAARLATICAKTSLSWMSHTHRRTTPRV
jgi:hypothetical protein